VSAQMMQPVDPVPVASTEEGAAAAEVPKKQFTGIPLAVEVSAFGLSKKDIRDALELEASMANEDRIITETADRRNDLESYIYAMRDKLSGEFKSFSSEQEKSLLGKMLGDAEEWLYGDGFDSVKALYMSKLDELRAVGDKIESRSFEAENRKPAVESLKKQVELCKSFVANMNDSHAHITQEERDQVNASPCHPSRSKYSFTPFTIVFNFFYFSFF